MLVKLQPNSGMIGAASMTWSLIEIGDTIPILPSVQGVHMWCGERDADQTPSPRPGSALTLKWRRSK